jgi:hypothetical protein
MRNLGGATLLLIAALGVLVGAFEGRKAYYDWRARGLCEKDGGVQVFEVLKLDASDYRLLLNAFGQLDIPLRSNAQPGTPVVRAETIEHLRQDGPRLTRYEVRIHRLSDDKTLGKMVSYSRVGGDLLAFQPSVFKCPTPTPDLFSMVVQKKGE